MKTIMFWVGVCVGLLIARPPLIAQVVDVNQFKVTVYNQTDAAPPAAPNFPNAYYFGTYLDTDPAFTITNVIATSPAGTELALNQYTPTYFENGTPYYSNETNFNADYPGGTYDYNFNYTDPTSNTYNADVIFDISTNDLYTTNIPAFTPACWLAMQAVDPARNFTLAWNGYTVTPGADYAFTFISITDHASGNSVIAPSGPPGLTFTNLPAGTLQYGRIYDVGLYFSERQSPVDYGFGNDQIIVGWDNLTMTTLITLPLWLQISPAGTNVILTWPADATNYQLQTTPSLAPSVWNAVTNNPTVLGTTNSLTLPATNATAFFRLAIPGN